ncbi:TetR/AcrR family transcriptional regulator, partial [Actinomadura adrarensis]
MSTHDNRSGPGLPPVGTFESPRKSPRRQELLEKTYDYALRNGLGTLSLRPLAEEIQTSPRVLLYLFGSKDGLIRAVFTRAREDQQTLLQRIAGSLEEPGELRSVAHGLWRWLSDVARRDLLRLWAESYARSLIEPSGPWIDFARDTAAGWLALLADSQPPALRNTEA